jgi:hypothetical protein
MGVGGCCGWGFGAEMLDGEGLKTSTILETPMEYESTTTAKTWIEACTSSVYIAEDRGWNSCC